MFRHVLGDRYFIRVVIIGFLFELITVSLMFITLGHAGPEGPAGRFGWIGLLLNTPGLAMASLWGSQFDSMIGVAVRVFVSQFFLILLAAFLIRYYMLSRKPT